MSYTQKQLLALAQVSTNWKVGGSELSKHYLNFFPRGFMSSVRSLSAKLTLAFSLTEKRPSTHSIYVKYVAQGYDEMFNLLHPLKECITEVLYFMVN